MRSEQLRTTRLDDRIHTNFLWRSDRTHTLYRYDGRAWQFFYENRWQVCYDGRDCVAVYTLGGQDGEIFVRVGKYL